ncbi:MAG: hypothetical protein QOJ49_1745 [Actinomycetota bacterium]|jgi:hypothetical protein|nr:hypothetical protein [Actinomycetota bacterium]
MSIREETGVAVTSPDIIVISSRPSVSGPPVAPVTTRGPRWPRLVVALVLAAVVLGVAALAASRLGNGHDVAQPTANKPAAVKPAAVPAALALTVAAPANVVAGKAVQIPVTYTDGSGVFSGTSEDWGDGVGTSSLKQSACVVTPVATPALRGSYVLRHTWAKPGTYPLTLEVVSYTCRGTTLAQERVTKTLMVTVSAP